MRNSIVGFLVIFLTNIQAVIIRDSDEFEMTRLYDEYGDSVTYSFNGVNLATSAPTVDATQAPTTASDPDILLPFLESAGSTRFQFGDDEHTEIRLQRSFKFLGTSYSSVYINGNGIITFGRGSSDYKYKCRKSQVEIPTVSVFMGDSHNNKGDGATTAKLLYRQDTSRSSLDRVSGDVFKAFPALRGSANLTWMLIVTWYNIPPRVDGFDRWRNTFQAVLTSDGTNSFVLLYYKSIQWPVLGYSPAEVGIYGGQSNTQNSYVIPGSCTIALLNITSMSNIEAPGKFAFKVDETVELPLTTDNRLPSSFRNDWELLPFLESSGSTSFLFEDDNVVDMTLTQSFNFLGSSYSTAYANENGIITFVNGTGTPRYYCNKTGVPFPTISVFMADGYNDPEDPSNIAKILYRQDTSRSSLDKVSADVFQAFPAQNGTLTLNWMLIVTWYNIPSLSGHSSFLRNTYQAVLTTDGTYSFVLFYYKEITWPEHKSEQKVEAGIYGGQNNRRKSYLIAGSCTDALSNIHTMTNIGIPGKFVFRVDNDIESPTNSTTLEAPILPPDFQGESDDSGESATLATPEIIDYDAPEVDHDLELLPHLESTGSRRFRFGDELYTHVNLDQAFNFLGRRYTTAYINGNGIITFTSGSGAHRYRCDYNAAFIPTISVYMSDSHQDRGDGHITAKLLYRQDTSRSSLDKVTRDVVTAFPELRGRIALNWTLVVTWSNIPPHDDVGSANQKNTFQAVLTTDGVKSFVLFYYKSITWPTSSRTAEAGIYGGRDNANNSYLVPGSCTRSLINIPGMSNMGRRGRFAFRVDRTIRQPSAFKDKFENDLELLPYLESSGSQRFYFGDDEHTDISLQQSFNFLGTSYSTAYINGNGIINFHNGSGAYNFNCNTTAAKVPTISAYLEDSHNNRGDGETTAKLLYRQDTSRSSLDKVSRDVFTAFPNLNGSITLTWMLIVTWYNIPAREENLHYLRNTFQAVLTRDGNGTHSFVLFYYKKITWPNAGFDDEDTKAEAGIFGGPGNFEKSYLIPGSCTHKLVNLTKTSNFGIPGKYVFRVDTEIGLPAPSASGPSVTPKPTSPSTVRNVTTEDDVNGTLPFENDLDVIPYLNSSGSERFYFADDGHVSVGLRQTFNFLGTNYSIAYVNGNGLISFGRGIGSYNYECNKLTAEYPTIGPYMEDADNRRGDGPTTAKLLYRQETSGPSLKKVSRDVLTGFPELAGQLNLTWMLLVSWDNIPPHSNAGEHTLRNTYQAVLTSDGSHSFVLFYYKNITWPVNDRTAEAGIYGGPLNLENSYVIPGSCTPALINITSMSNIGVPGKFVFRVDSALRFPSITPCVPNVPSGLVRFKPGVLPAIGEGSLFSPHLSFCPNSDPPLVTCVFYDGGRKNPVKVEGSMLPGDMAAVCRPPEFYRLGRARVDMILNFTNGEVISMHGFLVIVKPSYNSYLKISTSRESGRKFLEASWTRSSTWYVRPLGRSMTIANNLTFTLMELRGNRWSQLYTFKDIPNTGVWRAELPEQLEGILLSDKLEAPPTIFKMSYSILISGQPAFDMEQNADISLATKELAKLKVEGDGDRVNIFDKKCKEWHDHEPTPPTDTLPCPTVLEQASLDWRFTKESVTFSAMLNPLNFTQFLQTNPSPSGAGSYCSYDAKGTLVIGYPYGSRLHRSSPFDPKYPWSHYWEDVLPYLQCCQLSYHKAQNCQKYFFAKRPPNNGVGYKYPQPFLMTRFAKLFTTDGTTFRMNGTGNLWLLKELGQTEVQIWVDKYVPGNGTGNATMGISSALLRSFGENGRVTKFQVSASRSYGLLLWLEDKPLNFWMDAQFKTVIPLAYDTFMLAADGVTVTTYGAYEIGFYFSTGTSLRFVFSSSSSGGFLNILGSVSTALTGEISGLMTTSGADLTNVGPQLCVSSRESLALVTDAALNVTQSVTKNSDIPEDNCLCVN